MTVLKFPKGEPFKQGDLFHPALWGMVASFADDPDRPLPTDSPALLNELMLIAGQAKVRLDAFVARLQAEAFEVDKQSCLDENPPF